MINPFYLTDRNLKIDFQNLLDSHNINHANSTLAIELNILEFRFELSYNYKV